MAHENMRLRLMVRRNGLPEARIVWNVPLNTDPTVSKLLEQVNDIFPLESGEWGLEDYAVELQDASGSSFECLHFQPVRSVLKEDDQVFIRPLFADDLRRRRVSGRIQISTDGKHLIDGIAFGRPLIKAPRGRPSLDIPPRKRRRILASGEEPGADEDEDDRDYVEDQDEDEVPMLLITDGGVEGEGLEHDVEFHGLDTAGAPEAENEGRDSEESDSEDLDSDGMDEDLEQELRDLQDENTTSGENERIVESSRESALGLETLDHVGVLQAAFPMLPPSVCENVLSAEGSLKRAYLALSEGFAPVLPESAIVSLGKPVQNGPVTVHPRRPNLSAKLKRNNAKPTTGYTQVEQAEESDDSGREDVPDFVKQFDHRGLPPGSISSGTALKAMAAMSGSLSINTPGINGDSAQGTLAGMKKSSEVGKAAENDDDTSSSGTSSSSSEDEGEAVDDSSDSSDDDESTSDDDGSSSVAAKPNGRPPALFDDSTSSSDDSSDESDGGPEETTAKEDATTRNRSSARQNNALRNDVDASSSSSEESSADDESSDVESSAVAESSEDESIQARNPPKTSTAKTVSVQATPIQARLQLQPDSVASSQAAVPPGSGKTATKKRNERRKLFNHAKKLAERSEGAQQDLVNSDVSTNAAEINALGTPDAESTQKAIFEARRQALLDAIADGGVEVGPNGAIRLDDAPRKSHQGPKRKRDEPKPSQPDEQEAKESSAAVETESPPSEQKRRRLDLGAGRRMLFGALGLRNPKTKDDEEKLRTRLMKDVRPHSNKRLEEQAAEDGVKTGGNAPADQPVDEDPDFWRVKINYRAVECCQEGIQLSEPPFPFVQRWDPQQQYAWSQKKNKRGGAGKKGQRNQAHYYQENNRHDKERQHGGTQDWAEGGEEMEESYYDDDYYDDDTFNGVETGPLDGDVVLNYDDPHPEEDPNSKDPLQEFSHLTDLDDLPSLPEDLTSLTPLLPGEVLIGMVVTWKQFFLSKATNWQPQLSNLTGIVVRIDDDATGVQVLLARRDRNLDRTEKQYDQTTGQRIYDRFEAPDMEDEEDGDAEGNDDKEDQGYRTLSFAEMGEPKILQQPLSLDDPSDLSKMASIEEDDVVETAMDIVEEASTNQPGQGQGEDVPPTADISLSEGSSVLSPSQQLRDETTGESVAAMLSHTSSHENRIDTQGVLETSFPIVNGLEPVVAAQITTGPFGTVEDGSVPTSIIDIDSQALSAAPKVGFLKASVPFSSAESVGSGRQPDYAMNISLDGGQPATLGSTESGDLAAKDRVSAIHDASDPSQSPTPTPARGADIQKTTFRRNGTPTREQQELTAAEDALIESSPAVTPHSLASLGTVWCTAATSHHTKSPTKSPEFLRSKNTSTTRDAEYEAAVFQLDEQGLSSSEVSEDEGDSEESHVPNSFGLPAAPRSSSGSISSDDSSQSDSSEVGSDQDVAETSEPDHDMSHPPCIRRMEAISPPPLVSSRKPSNPAVVSITKRRSPRTSKGSATQAPKRTSSPFGIPPGTQVLEISSDSDGVHLEGDSAEELDNQTHASASSSLLKGEVVGQKKGVTKERGTRGLATSAVSSATKVKHETSTQRADPKLKSAAAVLGKGSRSLGKRKGSAKF